MKIAFTYNLRLSDDEDEAEFDTRETVEAIAASLTGAGHEVEKLDVARPTADIVSRLETFAPDLVFNTAEGRRGRAREAFFPALFEELGLPFTGSDAYVLTLTLDKWLTKLAVTAEGIDTPRARLVTQESYRRQRSGWVPRLAFPVIVKPNYEGSSKGIADEFVATDEKSLAEVLPRALKNYPAGVLVEEFVPGVDVMVPFVEGLADDGVLEPVDLVVEAGARSRHNLYDFRLKVREPGRVKFRCPAELPRDVLARLEALSLRVVHALGLRDVGRIDFRVGDDGRIYFLEANGLPNLSRGSATFVAAARLGLSYDATIAAIVAGAARRYKLEAPAIVGKGKIRDRLRVGFAFNVKRVDTKGGNDAEAEYDAPETIDSIRQAIQSHGHDVVMLEANADFPRALAEAGVDFVFNIAEGVAGRNREAAVPALCELMGLAYTGSDAATLSVALDKALSKKVLKQHDIKTADFQLMETGREKLTPRLRFPLIVKPNQEGSSKGVSASASVVDDEAQLRGVVRELIERYRQPALIEEYITGREFTVGLLGERRPRVLPPMEIIFKDQVNKRPVYDFQIKQDWERHVAYECPAKLTNAELKAIEKTARETFTALDCRDVGRVDLRMTPTGEVFVIEINPLPGLTPGYSDLCLIATAAGIDYRDLIGEILAGGLKRMRQRRRQPAVEPADNGRTERPKPPVVQRGNGATTAPAASPESGPLAVDVSNDESAATPSVRGQ